MNKNYHDPKRFYHCDCLEGNGIEHDPKRFYHCDCLEGGYDPFAEEGRTPPASNAVNPHCEED